MLNMSIIRFLPEQCIWVATSAVACGDLQIGPETSVWHHAVVRGDVAPIRIGRRVNIQDHAVLHCHQGVPLTIDDDVSIGHHAVVHCARVGRGSLIGINSTVLDGAVIGTECIVGAGAVVTPGTVVPDGTMMMGVPARAVRVVSAAEREYSRLVVASYVELARRHAAGEFPRLGE